MTRVLAGTLRYGENPHQDAALYIPAGPHAKGLPQAEQVQGKELSYNNYNDANAAFELAAEFAGQDPAVIIVKHANPCGVAQGASLLEAWQGALACDDVSAFGGIVATNVPLDGPTAEAICQIFTEVVVAPGADEEPRTATVPSLRGRIRKALERYEEERRPVVERIQKAAQDSLQWFENVKRYKDLDPAEFAFSLLTRSKRITFDNLRLRDAEQRRVVRLLLWFHQPPMQALPLRRELSLGQVVPVAGQRHHRFGPPAARSRRGVALEPAAPLQ